MSLSAAANDHVLRTNGRTNERTVKLHTSASERDGRRYGVGDDDSGLTLSARVRRVYSDHVRRGGHQVDGLHHRMRRRRVIAS